MHENDERMTVEDVKRNRQSISVDLSPSAVSNNYVQLLEEAKHEIEKLQASNIKLQCRRKVAVDVNVGLKECWLLLNVQ